MTPVLAASRRITVYACLTMAVAAHAGNEEQETMRIRLGDDVFGFPQQNLRDSNVPFWLRLVPGLAPSRRGVLLTVPAEQITEEVRGYRISDGDYRTNINVHLEILDESELRTYRDPQWHLYSDAWYGRGPHANQIIELDENSGFYKVHGDGNDVFWTATRIVPQPMEHIPRDPFDFWVAECRTQRSTPIMESEWMTTCASRVLVDDMSLYFRIRGFNLHLFDEIKRALLEMLEEWREA